MIVEARTNSHHFVDSLRGVSGPCAVAGMAVVPLLNSGSVFLALVVVLCLIHPLSLLPPINNLPGANKRKHGSPPAPIARLAVTLISQHEPERWNDALV